MYENRDPYEGEPRKKDSFARRAGRVAAGAVLFGAVAGAVMVGVNEAAARLWGDPYAGTVQESQTAAPEELPPVAPPPAARSGPDTDVTAIVEKAMPSVVAITSMTRYQSRSFGFGWFFGGGQTYEVPGSGSGIIIGENDTELLIVTNNHVVENTSSLMVTFVDDESVEAAVKGTDASLDLAVIAVPLENISEDTKSKISFAELGDSDALKVGQGVIAIGNALGYGQSVTVGYVSALNREVRVSETSTMSLIQTDAAINPGNSGGALLNMQGQVIGINAAKYSSAEVEGMGYAIPISQAKEILDRLTTHRTEREVEEERRGYLGIQGTSVDAQSAVMFGMPEGVFVYKILEGGAAYGSGLKEKDIITKVDGQAVRSMEELQALLSYYEQGEEIELTVQTQVEGQYQEHTVTVTLGSMPESGQ